MAHGEKIDDAYITQNLMETAFLAHKGFNYDVRKDDGKAFFVFKDYKNLIEDLLREFWSGSRELKLLDTFRAVKRTAVFDGYQKNFYRDGNRQ